MKVSTSSLLPSSNDDDHHTTRNKHNWGQLRQKKTFLMLHFYVMCTHTRSNGKLLWNHCHYILWMSMYSVLWRRAAHGSFVEFQDKPLFRNLSGGALFLAQIWLKNLRKLFFSLVRSSCCGALRDVACVHVFWTKTGTQHKKKWYMKPMTMVVWRREEKKCICELLTH